MRRTILLVLLAAAGYASAESPSSPPATQADAAAPAPAAQANATSTPADKAEPAAKSEPTQRARKRSGSGGVTNKDGKVCRTESVTNTRLKTKKVCLTPDEWTARSEAAQDAFRDTNKSPTPPPLGGGG